MIDRAVRCGQNLKTARREAQSKPGVLTSRATQRRHVRPRRAEQISLAYQWMRLGSGMQRTANAHYCAHLRGHIPKGSLLFAPVRSVTLRDDGCDAVREAPVREQTQKPRPAAFDAAAVWPFPLHCARDLGAIFAPGVVAHCLFGPAKRRCSRLAGTRIVAIARASNHELGSTFIRNISNPTDSQSA